MGEDPCRGAETHWKLVFSAEPGWGSVVPRTVEITVPPDSRATLVGRLEQMDGVAAVLVFANASHLPPGDLVRVRGTNQAAEKAVRIAAWLTLPAVA